MLKNKTLLAIIIIAIMVFAIPTIANAAVEYTRNIYANDGSMKFTFTGLTIDTTHEYEYGLTKNSAATVGKWYQINENTETSITVNIISGTKEIREVMNAVDIGYITIKDKTADTVILEPYAVDLKMPYLRVTNYNVVSNGQKLDGNYEVNISLRDASNSKAYYKYEKVTDETLINKYKEIKANSGDYSSLESMIKTSAPNGGYSTWDYWNGYHGGRDGFGYPQRTVNAPDEGLYYLWVYFSGDNINGLYGCILVDNLQPEIAVQSISLSSTKTIKLGNTITLIPEFNPANATNKIVTWTSSDEEVATVDNAGKITPKKVGSTIITVTTQDGNKKATCTVTVTGEEPEDDDVSVETVTLDKTEISLEVGKTDTLVPTIAPSSATNKKVSYTTSDEKIAKVSAEGVVTAVAEGTATITVTTEDGAKTATCKVIVTKAATEDVKKTFGDHKYQIIEQTMSWEEAKAYCESLGGYLVTITSAEEQKFIEDYINEKGYKNKRFWLGFSDATKEGTWSWVTGESNKYANWGKSLDNGYSGTQDYAALVGFNTSYNGKKVNFGQWDDVQKTKQSDCYFICEWGEYKKGTDQTTTKNPMPDAGKTIAISVTFLAIIALGTLGFVKYKKYKDV